MFSLSSVLLFCCPRTASRQRRLKTFRNRSFCKHLPPSARCLGLEGSLGRASCSWYRAAASHSPPQSEDRWCCLCTAGSNKSGSAGGLCPRGSVSTDHRAPAASTSVPAGNWSSLGVALAALKLCKPARQSAHAE